MKPGVRCWEYRQMPAIVRVQHASRPDKVNIFKKKNIFYFHWILFINYFQFCFGFCRKCVDLYFDFLNLRLKK